MIIIITIIIMIIIIVFIIIAKSNFRILCRSAKPFELFLKSIWSFGGDLVSLRQSLDLLMHFHYPVFL